MSSDPNKLVLLGGAGRLPLQGYKRTSFLAYQSAATGLGCVQRTHALQQSRGGSACGKVFYGTRSRSWKGGSRRQLLRIIYCGRPAASSVWTFHLDARRRIGWILLPPRRSFEPRILLDRQGPMKNVALDYRSTVQLDADGVDGALDAATDDQLLRRDITLDLRAFSDKDI